VLLVKQVGRNLVGAAPVGMLSGIDADPPRATDGSCRGASRPMIYIHPPAADTLQRYGVGHSSHRPNTKVQDVVVEAFEDWFDKRGLLGPVRAKETKKQRRVKGVS
jgi:hypothetical protein